MCTRLQILFLESFWLCTCASSKFTKVAMENGQTCVENIPLRASLTAEIGEVLDLAENLKVISNDWLRTTDKSKFYDFISEANNAISRGFLEEAESSYASALKLVYQNEVDEDGTIVCLQGLGDVYLASGKNSKDGEEFTKASALYNSALVRCEHGDRREALTTLIKETEKEFLISILGHEIIGSNEAPYDDHKATLKSIRDSCSKSIKEIDIECDPVLTPHDPREIVAFERKRIVLISDVFRKISEDMIVFVQSLIRECISRLGKPPCRYAVIGLGSLAREEMTPYSDLEFAILVECTKESNLVYFRNLTHFFHLKVLALGETILPSMSIVSLNDFYSGVPERNWFYDEGPKGFSFDGAMPWACKSPLGRKETEMKEEMELIKTPDDMAALQLEEIAVKEGYHLADVLAKSVLIEGDEELERTYRERVKKILQTPSSSCKQWSNGRKRGYEALFETYNEFQTTASDWEEAGKVFHVKREVYRFPSLVLSSLVLYYNLDAFSPGDVIDQLLHIEVITEEAAYHLHFTVALANELRLRSYLAGGEQRERITGSALPRDEPKTPHSENQGNVASKLQNVFHVPDPDIIFRLFQTVVPLQKAVQKFLSDITSNRAADVHEAVPFQKLYDNSPNTQAIIYFRFHEFEKARACLETVVNRAEVDMEEDLGKVSELFGALLTLGNVCLALGDIQGAVGQFDKAAQLETMYEERDEIKPYSCNLLVDLGRGYHSIGEHKKSLFFHEKALSLKDEAGDQSLPSITKSINGIAVAHLGMGNYEKAIFYFNKSLDLVRQSGSSSVVSSSYTIPIINMMAANASLGELEKVKEAYREVSRIFPSLYGVGVIHPHMATALTNLATAYKTKEAYSEATKLYEQALVIRKRLYGRNTAHPATASLLSNLGHAYYGLRNLTKASQFCAEALEMKREIYKEQLHHPSIINLLKLLGVIGLAEGDVSAAVKAYEENLSLLRVIYHANIVHKDVCATLNNLGYAYYEAKDFNKAITCLEEARSLWIRHLGGSIPHIKLAMCLNNLGNTCRNLGQYKKAYEYCREGLNMRNALQGSDACSDGVLAKSFTDTGHCCASLGDYRNAVSHYERALQIRSKLGEDLVAPCNDLANGYSRLGEHAKAIQYYKDAIRHNEEKYGAGKVPGDHMYPPLSNLGSEYIFTGEYSKAVEILEQALDMIDDDSGGSRSRHIGIALNDLGTAYRNLKEYTKAEKYLKQALEVKMKVHGEKPHAEVASTLSNLGNICTHQEKFLEAIEYYSKALEMKQMLYGPNSSHQSIALTLGNMGSLYIQLEQYDKAVNYIKNALQIFSMTSGAGIPKRETGTSFCTLGQAYEGLGDWRTAYECYEKAVKILALIYGNSSHPLLVNAITNWKRLRHLLN